MDDAPRLILPRLDTAAFERVLRMIQKFGAGFVQLPPPPKGRGIRPDAYEDATHIYLVCQHPAFLGDLHPVFGISMGKLRCFFVDGPKVTLFFIHQLCL